MSKFSMPTRSIPEAYQLYRRTQRELPTEGEGATDSSRARLH